MASSLAEGDLYKITTPLRVEIDTLSTSDMKMAHATQRASALEESILHLVTRAVDAPSTAALAIRIAWDHPEQITRSATHAVNKTL